MMGYNFSKNPVRDAVCTALYLRGRKFYIPHGEPYPPRPVNLYDFITGKSYIYLMVSPELGVWNNEQVWEGFTLQEIIENHNVMLPRIWNEYKKNDRPIGVFEMFDKFSRMKDPIQMAAYATRQLAQLKRH